MNLLLIGRKVGLGAVHRSNSRESHIHRTCVLRKCVQVVVVVDRCVVMRIGCLRPVKALADSRGFARRTVNSAFAVTDKNVVTCAAINVVIAVAAIDFIVAIGRNNSVIAITSNDDVVVTSFTGQDRIVVVDFVAVRVTSVGNVDQVITCGAFNYAIHGGHGGTVDRTDFQVAIVQKAGFIANFERLDRLVTGDAHAVVDPFIFRLDHLAECVFEDHVTQFVIAAFAEADVEQVKADVFHVTPEVHIICVA